MRKDYREVVREDDGEMASEGVHVAVDVSLSLVQFFKST